MAQPRSGEYWEADAAGELALRPLALPFPLCHTYVNHRYKIIFIIHPKRCVCGVLGGWGFGGGGGGGTTEEGWTVRDGWVGCQERCQSAWGRGGSSKRRTLRGEGALPATRRRGGGAPPRAWPAVQAARCRQGPA
jgi:hypothetical protein